jgi:hypothetical protein
MNVKFAFVGAVCAIAIMAVQSNGETASLIALMEQTTAPDAFADQYGQVIVGELAKILTEQGDATCRKARNLGEKELLRGADEILVKYGTKVLALESGRISEDALAAQLDKDSGAGSASELRRLSDDHSVNELRKFFRPKFNDIVVNHVADPLSHYAAAHQLFRGTLDPIESGNMAAAMLAVDIESAAEDAARKARSDNRNAGRFVDLYVSAINAYDLALLQGESLFVFDGVQAELKALCLPIRDSRPQ